MISSRTVSQFARFVRRRSLERALSERPSSALSPKRPSRPGGPCVLASERPKLTSIVPSQPGGPVIAPIRHDAHSSAPAACADKAAALGDRREGRLILDARHGETHESRMQAKRPRAGRAEFVGAHRFEASDGRRRHEDGARRKTLRRTSGRAAVCGPFLGAAMRRPASRLNSGAPQRHGSAPTDLEPMAVGFRSTWRRKQKGRREAPINHRAIHFGDAL
jgi:hypothetical protein